MRERLDVPADSEEMTEEVAITERAIARTKMEDKAYWHVIKKYYLGRLNKMEIAAFYHVSYDGLNRLFQQAKSRISEHISDIERET